MFVTRGFPLPARAERFKVALPDTDYRVHGVVAEGVGSVMVVEYALPAERTRDTEFEAVADNELHSPLPADFVYIGTYFTLPGGYLHVYGPRGLTDRDVPRPRALM
jgi:hypothetical protein